MSTLKNIENDINKFPSKKKKDMDRIVKTLVATTFIGGSLATFNSKDAKATILSGDDLKEYNYVEKEATVLDPSLKNSVDDLKGMESYIQSSFEDKVKDDDHNEMLVSEKDKTFMQITNNDYLQYISGNSDVVTVHYVDNSDKLLLFEEDEDGNYTTHHHSGGWFIYPFIFNGGSYNSSNGLMNTNKNMSGANTYSSNFSTVKSNVSNVKSSVGSASSKGLGSSMKSSSSRGYGG